MKLTAKQRLFADEYIKSGNATQSAIKAGYAVKSAQRMGSENLSKPVIKSYIDAKMAEIESHKIADAKEVLEFYTRVLRGEETEPKTIMQRDGSEELVDVPPSLKDKIAVAKELMKRYPLSDPIVKAQLKKITADARVSEARAKSMEDGDADVETLVTQLISSIQKGGKDNESK